MLNGDFRCNHVQAALIDYVYGHPLCEDMRKPQIVDHPSQRVIYSGGPCGPEAKLWEARK